MKKFKPSIPNALIIYTKRTNHQTTDTNYLYHKYKPFVPEVQGLCTGSTNPLYY